MKKYTLILLILISFTANSQIVNKFRDSTWFAKGVRFDSEIYLTKGASNGKVLTSNAFGCATWQTASGGVSQTTLNDSITAVRSIRKVDTIYRSLDSIIFKINGIRYSIKDSSGTSSGGGDITKLLPKGVKLVMSSRDFQADDKDFILYCPIPSTIITMPTVNPFSEGDYVGVVMSSPDSYVETWNSGIATDKIYPYTANPSGTTLEQQSASEVVILRATNTGSVKLLPLSGAVKESNDINGSNFKTLSRYNYDQSQNVTDSQSLSLAFSDSIRMSISRGNTISFAYAYDSVSTNTAGDSIITFKAGLRRAYKIVSGSSGSTFNGLTGATGTNSINNADYSQEWKWNTLTSGGLNLTSTSSTLSANSSLFCAQLNTNQPTSGASYYAGKFINRNVTGGSNVALYLNTPFGAPARALQVDTGDVYLTKNNSFIWANGATIAATTYMQLTAPTSGYMIFRSNSNNGFHFWNSSAPFFTVYNASSTQHGTIFGGDYASGAFRSVGTSAATIERNVGNLIFSANTGLSGGYAPFTPNNIMTVSGANSNVGIGTTSPSSKAALDVVSTTKGFLPPRMTTTQRDAISSPDAGLIIYNTTSNKLNFYNGSAWEVVTSL